MRQRVLGEKLGFTVCRPYPSAALNADRVLAVSDSEGGRVLAFKPGPAAGLPLHPFRA